MRHSLFLLAASLARLQAAAVIPCTADEDCLSDGLRCLQAPAQTGSPCTLDYAYNETGWCSCQPQSCVNLTGPAWNPKLKQWLVIGDSISLGQMGAITAKLSSAWQVVHAPSFSTGSTNNDNAYWGSRCVAGWLGPQPQRWDVVSYNAGQHDLAFPDNEHLEVDTYAGFVAQTLKTITSLVRPTAIVEWMRITPVPTNPPPQGGKSCVLIPGRLESNVLAYNAAADGVVAATQGRVGSCDLHSVITDYCGVGYAQCNITQCAGPHFSELGFSMLAGKAMQCVGAV